jgi:N-sulfoglucosamine sulfohydrolase
MSKGRTKMNILYIHTHDTGRYIQAYGYPVSTPHLMELAREGVVFRNAFSVAPTCSPSRAGMLTGMTPHESGMLGLANRGFQLYDYSKHIVSFFKKNGYETVLAGIQHVAPDPETIGYDKVLSRERPDMRAIGFDSVSFDRKNASYVAEYLKKATRPFFLSFGMYNTHREFPEISPEIQPDFILPPPQMFDNPISREDMAGFLTSARIMDECAGKVLKALREAGLEKDTLVMFTTDHGIAFPQMKCTLFDSGIGVSLIMKLDGKIKGGWVTDALVSQIDVFPTLCEFLGLDKPDWLEGLSLYPLLMNEKKRIRDQIFAEISFHAGYEPMRCIRTERYKLIRFFDDYENIIPVNTDDGMSKDFLIAHGYRSWKRQREMLFDLYLDPLEKTNLFNSEPYREIYRDLSDRLLQWMKDTNDPLIQGRIRKPKGARINKRSCVSHKRENDFEEEDRVCRD